MEHEVILAELARADETLRRLALAQSCLAERAAGRREALEWVAGWRSSIPPLDALDSPVPVAPWTVRWQEDRDGEIHEKALDDRDEAERFLDGLIRGGIAAGWMRP